MQGINGTREQTGAVIAVWLVPFTFNRFLGQKITF